MITRIVQRSMMSAFMAALLFLLVVNQNAAADDLRKLPAGAVYVMNNQAEGNTIVVFQRDENGSLTRVQEVSTGGRGSGPIPLPPPVGGPNPLDSQDGLLLVDHGRLLLAVNAGSNEVSVLAVAENGLRLVGKVASGGEYPVSIACHGSLVYVLNSHGLPNITGFTLDHSGKLQPIPGSTRGAGPESADPAQVIFSPDGDLLVVTERLADFIDVFRVQENGQVELSARIASNNHTPFAATLGKHHIMALSESNESQPRIAVPNGGSVSTYRFTDDSTLEPISQGTPDNQSGTCWVRITPDGRFAFAANTGSGSISSYAVSNHGELTLLQSIAAETGGPFSVPVDMAITPDGKYLYILSSLIGTLKGYRIGTDGSLSPFVNVSGFPISMQGIAVR